MVLLPEGLHVINMNGYAQFREPDNNRCYDLPRLPADVVDWVSANETPLKYQRARRIFEGAQASHSSWIMRAFTTHAGGAEFTYIACFFAFRRRQRALQKSICTRLP
jgi:hypothetical protein